MESIQILGAVPIKIDRLPREDRDIWLMLACSAVTSGRWTGTECCSVASTVLKKYKSEFEKEE